MLKLDERFRNQEFFIISLFSLVQISVLRVVFLLQFFVDILPLGSGSVDPHIFADPDPDPGYQNLADPKHCLGRLFSIYKYLQTKKDVTDSNWKFKIWQMWQLEIENPVHCKLSYNTIGENILLKSLFLGTTFFCWINPANNPALRHDKLPFLLV